MKLLFLRGQVPQDRDPQEIVFDRIEDCDDVWTQLAFALTGPNDSTELWYWGGKRKQAFSANFTERWLPSFDAELPHFEPDVIMCRGGFSTYHSVLKRFPKAFKIYYGAGQRFLPQKGYSDYQLILQDSPQQLAECQRSFPNIQASLFIKPAADNLFHPLAGVQKQFDVCFPANGRQARFKGHPWVFSSVPRHLKMLNLGNASKLQMPSNVTRKRVLRTEMNAAIQSCKVGIVASDGKVDSCPRVIPEMLAAGLPIVVLDETRFWSEQYITPESGHLASRANFWEVVQSVLSRLDAYRPAHYYQHHLSLHHAAAHIRSLLPNTL